MDEAIKRIAKAKHDESEDLDLSDLALDTLPISLVQLTGLQELHLGDNQLSALPAWFGQLKSLQRLALSNNQFNSLPKSLTQLKKLRELFLSHNHLTSIHESLQELTALKWLALSDNQLTILPNWLGLMKKLQELHLSGNRITTLPSWFGQLTELEALYLSNNQIKSLPEQLLSLPKLKWLYLHKNPKLGLPDEILGPTWDTVSNNRPAARPSDILAYYFKTRKSAAPLNEVKMLFVGRGEVGKSSIRDCLLGSGFDPSKKETSSIEIRTWSIKHLDETICLHVWDFAGQELTHGTHQFFLTERSVYILVLDARADTQDTDTEYWLRLITAFGGDSPIIVALNKWDSKPFDVDRFAIRERYPNVRAFIPTDCKTARGLLELNEEIHATVASMKSVREPFPNDWSDVKVACSVMEANHLTFEAFCDLCESNGVTSKHEQESLARILHRLGIVLHYADDPRLRENTVLKPHWVTESLYKLLRLKEGPNSDGLLTFAEACAALPKEKPEMVKYLIWLMRRFELCFPVDETTESWLVPELLSKFQPELGTEWQALDALRIRYKYNVLPEGLLTRFITRTYPLSDDQLRWRGGVVLKMDSSKALVRAGNSQLNATIIGNIEGCQRLAKLIRNHLAHIHADLKGLEPEELIEVEGHPGNFKSVTTLELDERNPNTITTIDTKGGSVPINQTHELNRISTQAARDPQQRRLRLFLSYSHKDIGMRDVFQENLALLEEDGLLEWWFDGKIVPGDDWDKEIRNQLEKADIIVFMVSTPFLASKYIRGVEIKRALERRKANEVELVSVILDNSAWQDRDFTMYQLIEVGNLVNRNLAQRRVGFNEVEKQLRKLINEILVKGGGNAQGEGS